MSMPHQSSSLLKCAPAVLEAKALRTRKWNRRQLKRYRHRFSGSPEHLEARCVLDGSALITEFMADNASTLQDEDNAYSDWLEIYNPTDELVDLTGWYLTDDASDLNRWQFPQTQLQPNQYVTVFASGKDRAASGGQLHTNFSLDNQGEDLLLVRPDLTVEHAYFDYAEQLEDIAYGLPDGGASSTTILGVDADLTYRVPTAADNISDWFNPAFDDSQWSATVPLDIAPIVISELSTSDQRFIEIQSVVDSSIDTAGWQVVINQAANGINGTNTSRWQLPDNIAAGQTLYRSDSIGDNYWGAPIDWTLEGDGWAMIIDDTGDVVDFVAWGYTEAEIDSLSINVGAFNGIAVGSDWIGTGGEVGGQSIGLGFTAYNDQIRGAGTHPWSTTYGANGTASGLLRDIFLNQETDVTLTTTAQGVEYRSASGQPAVGTDAFEIFNGYVDFANGTGDSLELNGSDFYRHTFSGLDTNSFVSYDFTGTAIRGSNSYTDRWTTVTLEGAESAEAIHSSGDGVIVISPTEVAIWVGDNDDTDEGYVARWTNIDPGDDGQFSVVSRQYTGNTPLGPATGSKGYALSGIRLVETRPAGNLSVLQRVGNVDSNDRSNFVRATSGNKGSTNPELVTPLPNVADASTGIGYGEAFASLVNADVELVSKNENASLWVRVPFEVEDKSLFDSLTLEANYDAGFVAYLNGETVVLENAPDEPTYNSVAARERSNADALKTAAFDISGNGLDSLQDGTNVLAIHVLNSSADDEDMLMLPQIIAGSSIPLPQYMSEATPNADNIPGALGIVEDTKFSVDRGFYNEPFQVEISSATPGAEIRYTLDGTEPADNSGFVYSEPITISATTNLRAAAFKPGFIPTNVDTQTYLFLDNVLQQSSSFGKDGTGIPSHVNWGHAGPDWEVDPQIVNHSDSRNQLTTDDLKAIPTLSLSMSWDQMFGSGGIYIAGTGSPRAVSVEQILPDGSSGFQINGSVQIQGGSSTNRWKSDKLSMRLKFTRDFGPTKLDYPFFGDGATDRYDTLILDGILNFGYTHPSTSQTNFAKFIQDQFVADLQNATGGYAPHAKYHHVYINGIYWGMYYVHERPDQSFAEEYIGGDKDDYDVLKHTSSTAVHGTTSNYSQLLARARTSLSSTTNYDRLKEILDIEGFVDYIITNFYAGNDDWDHHNWYASFDKVSGEGKWRFHSWDAEHVLKNVNTNMTSENNSGGPTEIHQRLTANTEYRMLFADRVQKHFFNDGPMTPENTAATYQALMDEIDQAVRGESARWGDNRVSSPYTRTRWLTVQSDLLNNYFPRRTGIVLNQFRGKNLFPSSNANAPVFRIGGTAQHGGQVDSGSTLTMTAGTGTIYYSLDGTDPRLSGGALAPTAIPYTGGLPVTGFRDVTARFRSSAGEWSALVNATFFVEQPADADNLRITEVNYHPHDPLVILGEPDVDDKDFEFVELANVSNQPINLNDVEFVQVAFGNENEGIEFKFDAEVLSPGERIVVVRDLAGFTARYGDSMRIAGEFDGSLSNGGERITLLDGDAQIIQQFDYNDSGPWPGRPDGGGATLEVIDVSGDYNDPKNWNSSVDYGGSPGEIGSSPPVSVVINEVLAHTDEPFVDTIELYNPTDAPIDMSRWYLSDSNANFLKYLVPQGTVIPAGGFLVLDESDFGGPDGFALSSQGDDVWLLSSKSNGRPEMFIDRVEFGATDNGVSIGRIPDGNADSELLPLSRTTFGEENAEHRPGEIIISEVQYNPSEANNDLEFIELYNASGQTIDLGGWQINDAIDLTIPSFTNLDPGAALVLVSFDPSDSASATTFRTSYGIGPEVQLIGPWDTDDTLDNGGEKISLEKPDGSTPIVYHILVDHVDYDDDAPWPASADGGGESLHRVSPQNLGTIATSFVAATPSPGSVPFTAAVVVGRHLFYNDSFFDGGDSDIGSSDANAISSLAAYQLGDGVASVNNYSNYVRGINGLMIDVLNLANPNDISPSDFAFRAGNSNDLSEWDAGPKFQEFDVTEIAPNTYRITMTWNDNAVKSGWLETTLLSTEATGLAEADTFYFGNAIGDTKNSATDAMVDGTDFAAVRDNPRDFLNRAAIDSVFDLNRDSFVDGTDLAIVRDFATDITNDVHLLNLTDQPAGEPAPVLFVSNARTGIELLDNRIEIPSILDAESEALSQSPRNSFWIDNANSDLIAASVQVDRDIKPDTGTDEGAGKSQNAIQFDFAFFSSFWL